MNILNLGYLRATQAWHLADGSECRHAIDTLRSISPSLYANGLWRSLETELLSTPRYVVCFSKKRNDTHQWKNYGSDGTGACIVFDPQKDRLLNSSWDVFECCYNQRKQGKRLDRLARNLKRHGESAVARHMSEFWKWNIEFKRQEFSPENEVRYVLSTSKIMEKSNPQYSAPEAIRLASDCAMELDSYPHPSELFDEKHRPFESFLIKEAIVEITLGPRFTATKRYWEYLQNNYKVTQI